METGHKGFNSTISANNICTPSINYWLAESLARIFNKAVKAGKKATPTSTMYLFGLF